MRFVKTKGVPEAQAPTLQVGTARHEQSGHGMIMRRTRKSRRLATTGIAVMMAAAVSIGVTACGDDGGGSGKAPTAAPPVGLVYGPPQTKVVLQIWEDVRCPDCKAAEAALGSIAKQYADTGKIRIDYYEVNRIDGLGGGRGSLKGGNALACAHDAGQPGFIAYRTQLFDNQPSETNDSYGSTSNLLSLASRVPGLRSPSFDQCVTGGAHDSWVKASYAVLRAQLGDRTQVPTFYINGKPYTGGGAANITDAQAAFRAALDAAIAGTN